ncbi:unnamed protein product [Adineta steineri]|uniref:Peptidase M28 domain-containing protein n=1 Tax=Adineta steineri TaxID=433720 RepID=A0A815B0W0_9BILA|nr:unnamed protein product [Adineta steineri]
MTEIVEETVFIPQISNTNQIHQQSHNDQHLKEFILWFVLLICLLLLAGPFAHHLSYSVPTVKTRTIARHVFSEERTLDYLINLTQYGSRVRNTRGNFDARDYLILQIKRICSMNKRHIQCELDLQNFTDSQHNQLQNILVRVSNSINKSQNISTLMLSAHYDSVEFSPGAGDDGSGVVIILELFSNLINDLTINFSNVPLIILFTNAEEGGLQGATAFITDHRWHFNIRHFLSIDQPLVIDYSRVARPRGNVILQKISKKIGIRSDYVVFNSNHFLLGYDFGFFLDGYTYHTPLDHPSTCKQGVIQDLGDNLAILIRNILLENNQQINDTDPLIYFDILSRYLIIYKLSTSVLIQKILIVFIIIIGIIRIICDHIYHRRQNFSCNDFHCIYVRFKNPLTVRIISIIIYSSSNILSMIVGLIFSLILAWIISKTQPVSWYGNSTLAIFLFSLPCLIGFIIFQYLFDLLHRCILRKSSQNSNEIHFDFEQNISILIVYSLSMIISIYSNSEFFYITLIWSIFICPLYLILIVIEFILHWKQTFEKNSHQLYLPLLISFFPLIHTIEIVHRFLRIFIPILTPLFSSRWIYRGNLIIFSTVAIPTLFFLSILQRTKQFFHLLLVLLISFFIVLIVACIRQPFNRNHPSTFYAKHTSESIYNAEISMDNSFDVLLMSQQSSITVNTYHGLALSPILDQFSIKSGHKLYNKTCFSSTNCTFDDSFNRQLPVEHIQIESMKKKYRIRIQHVLSYNIGISSLSNIKLTVQNQFDIPRKETIVDIILNSILSIIEVDIKIQRCEINDSPFLLLFTRLMPNIVLKVNSTTTATCNFTACNSQRISCSSNLNCDCFSLTSNSNIGICALATLSCESFVRCNMDNVTCSIESTICVNSTRCGQPVCYPLPLANKQICPPKTVTSATTTQKSTTTTKKLTTITTPKPTTTTKISTTTSTSTGWFSTGNMTNARSDHTASVLSNGKVLVTGGGGNSGLLNSAELYNPSTGTWTSTGNMTNARMDHTASVLSNGKVLVTGGTPDNRVFLDSAELYDPLTSTWTTTGTMTNGRAYYTASVLLNGKVLVTGGYSNGYTILNSAELYDPSTGTWTTTGNMTAARYFHTASVLSNGKVLVTGGTPDNRGVSNSAELYDPSTGTWTSTGNMTIARDAHTASVLLNGKVLVAAGDGTVGALNSAELYDPSTGTWTTTGNMTNGRWFHTASVLLNGKVLVTGGDGTVGALRVGF